MLKWIIGALVGVIVMICAFIIIDPNASFVSTDKVNNSSLNMAKINVQIDGAVVNPGIYTLDSGSTLQDLVNQAGGLLSSADNDCFNLTTVIDNYELFYIPFEAGYKEECVPVTEKKVNINTATKEELATINGISETIAEKMIEYRQLNGEFKTLEEIMLVSGIGTKTYEKIRSYITLK
jgi:competence protein ComEA